MSFLLQQNSGDGVPSTLLAALAGLLVVAGTQLPGIIKTGRSWVDGRTQERRATMKSYEKQIEQQIEQNGKLFEEIQRDHAQLAAFNQTMLDTQRLMTEQQSLFNQERTVWKEEMQKMTQTAEITKTVNEALAKENLDLKAENERLRQENQRLRDELKKVDTDKLNPADVPDSDPADGNRVLVRRAELVPPDAE